MKKKKKRNEKKILFFFFMILAEGMGRGNLPGCKPLVLQAGLYPSSIYCHSGCEDCVPLAWTRALGRRLKEPKSANFTAWEQRIRDVSVVARKSFDVQLNSKTLVVVQKSIQMFVLPTDLWEGMYWPQANVGWAGVQIKASRRGVLAACNLTGSQM